MKLIIFNIIIGVLLIIAAIGFFIQLHCKIKTTNEDSYMRGSLRSSYAIPIFFIIMAMLKLNDLKSDGYIPKLDISDAIFFIVDGIFWILMTKFVRSKEVTDTCSESVAGYVAGTAMFLMGAIDLLLTII